MKNATYWIEEPGQIEPDEVVYTGYRSASLAWDAQKKLGQPRCMPQDDRARPTVG